MQYTLTKWNSSNYEINLVVDEQTTLKLRDKVLKHFQKDMDLQWFRKWHVPLDIVMKNISPEYLMMWIYEEAIHEWLNQILKENETIQFIWNIYDLNYENKEKDMILKFKLDIFPEVIEKNKNWESEKLNPINDEPSNEEIESTINNLKKQYAEYVDAPEIMINTVSKIRFEFKDKDNNTIDKWSTMLWPEDYQEFAILKTLFEWKKKEEKFSIKYNQPELPVFLHHKKEWTPTEIEYEILDIKDIVLPELNEENIKKFFWNEIKNIDELNAKIKELISAEKRKNLLNKEVDELINKISTSFELVVPKTMIDEEVKVRLESIEKRFNWKKWLEEYYEKIWEEEKNKMLEEIKWSSKTSIEKFMILKKYTELIWIDKDIDWQKPFDVEEKLYSKLATLEDNSKKTKSKK